MRLAVAAALLTLTGVPLAAQDLAAAAEKERERRRKVGPKAQVYTNDDISKEKPGSTPTPSPAPGRSSSSVPRRLLGPGATEGYDEPTTPSEAQEAGCEGPGCGDDSSAPGSGTTKGEDYWRQRAEALRDAVSDAEAKVRELEQQLAGVRQGQSQPLPIDALRQVPPNPLLAPPGAEALAQQLEKAKAELARAQQALQGLDEEARKAGVPPGWIR